jgi:hypothetical protein
VQWDQALRLGRSAAIAMGFLALFVCGAEFWLRRGGARKLLGK